MNAEITALIDNVELVPCPKDRQTRRLQRRSLRLPTRSKSAQTGHLCTTAQAGADPGIFVGLD